MSELVVVTGAIPAVEVLVLEDRARVLRRGRVKVIAGQFDDAVGPVRQPATDPTYLDIRLDAGVDFSLPVPVGHSAFVYVYEGGLSVGGSR